jgi:hypothetical protein
MQDPELDWWKQLRTHLHSEALRSLEMRSLRSRQGLGIETRADLQFGQRAIHTMNENVFSFTKMLDS